jgi:hypothetical protein
VCAENDMANDKNEQKWKRHIATLQMKRVWAGSGSVGFRVQIFHISFKMYWLWGLGFRVHSKSNAGEKNSRNFNFVVIIGIERALSTKKRV